MQVDLEVQLVEPNLFGCPYSSQRNLEVQASLEIPVGKTMADEESSLGLTFLCGQVSKVRLCLFGRLLNDALHQLNHLGRDRLNHRNHFFHGGLG